MLALTPDETWTIIIQLAVVVFGFLILFNIAESVRDRVQARRRRSGR